MILIVGATGVLGGAITRKLLDQGREVRILVRENSPSEELAKQGMATPAASLIAAGAQPCYGDLKEPASLAAAVTGINTVITTANSAIRGGEDNVKNVDLNGSQSLINAAKTAGVDHFIYTSASIADPASPVPFVAAKAESERALQASGMPYTITAPNSFMEIWLGMIVGKPALSGQPVTLVGSGDRVHSFISIGDVASFTVAAVDNARAANQRLLLGGPKAISFRDAAAIYAAALGRPVQVNCVPPGTPVSGLSDFIAANLAAYDTYDSPMDMDQLAADYAITLTSFETVVQRMLSAP